MANLDEDPLISVVIGLAGRAADISSKLSAAQQTLSETSGDVERLIDELATLAATLWGFVQAITEDASRFTQPFSADLAKNLHELDIVFAEISDGCEALRRGDSTSDNVFSQLLKKSEVQRVQKHLEAINATLVFMRNLLQHGRRSGMQTSVILPEGKSHMTDDDSAILDSVLATDRDAILRSRYMNSSHRAAKATAEDKSSGSPGAQTTETPPAQDILPAVARATLPFPSTPPQQILFGHAHLDAQVAVPDTEAHSASRMPENQWIQPSQTHAHDQLPESPAQVKASLVKHTGTGDPTEGPQIAGRSPEQLQKGPTKTIDHPKPSCSPGIPEPAPPGRRRSSFS